MRPMEFFKQCVMQFFIITACVTLATALIGPYLLPKIEFSYHAFYSPPLIGLLCTLPAIILYSKKELSLKQTIVRKLLHLLAIELLICIPNWLSGNIKTTPALFFLAVTVLVVYVIVNLASWFFENRDAQLINEELKKLQKRTT